MDVGVVVGVVVLGVALALRVVAGSRDHARIRRHVAARGGRLLASRWAPFGPGWAQERIARTYLVRYRDREGNEHRAYCKTSSSSGVSFTDDQVVRPPSGDRVAG
jgi:hypothetical protein